MIILIYGKLDAINETNEVKNETVHVNVDCPFQTMSWIMTPSSLQSLLNLTWAIYMSKVLKYDVKINSTKKVICLLHVTYTSGIAKEII